MTRPLVLASTSRYRHKLLSQLDLPFVAAAPDFDERPEDHRFAALGAEGFALYLAHAKASSLGTSHPDGWILAADQIVVLPPGELLHKPENSARAVDQLMRMSGHQILLITGVVLLDATTQVAREAVDRHHLTLRAFGRAEAEAYVARHQPLDCAGSFRIEDAGITLFERIEGADFTSIIGLPLLAVCRLLRGVGLLPGP
jgi:septum formation protein